MSYWLEVQRLNLLRVFPSKSGRTEAVVAPHLPSGDQYRLYFRRWIRPDKTPVFGRIDPDGWREVWPRSTITSSDLTTLIATGKSMVESMERDLEDLVSSGFEVRPLPPPKKLDIVSEMEWDNTVKAIIIRQTEDLFEVRWFARFNTVDDDKMRVFPPSDFTIGPGEIVVALADNLADAKLLAEKMLAEPKMRFLLSQLSGE